MSKNDFDALSCTKDSVIITDDAVYNIDILTDINELEEINEDTAYIDNDVYYVYRGVPKGRDISNLKPGIYDNKNGSDAKYFLVEPSSDAEKEEYCASTHVSSLTPVSIIDTANTKEELLIAIPESSKVFQPTLSENDDILKRVAKMALIKKNVDLDRHKNRFTNKNELFNFKQVIRGDNKLSILIFNRGCDALNLKYSIKIEEKNENDIVGDRLTEPIIVSSEDTYEL